MTDWIASLERNVAQMIERIAPTVINSLVMNLQVSIEETMFGQFQELIDSQLSDADVFLSTVQAQVELVLSFYNR